MFLTWHGGSWVELQGWRRCRDVGCGSSSAGAGQSCSWLWCTWRKIRWLCRGCVALFHCWASGRGWSYGSWHPLCCVSQEPSESPEAYDPDWSAICFCRHFRCCHSPRWPWWYMSQRPVCCRQEVRPEGSSWRMMSLGSVPERRSWGLDERSCRRSWKDSQKKRRTWHWRRSPLLHCGESPRETEGEAEREREENVNIKFHFLALSVQVF